MILVLIGNLDNATVNKWPTVEKKSALNQLQYVMDIMNR